ncbi:helix-turn-helix transcriptional regulator [Buttiauxella gaviniae]|uniref:helix-turn-helix transcriptional regulator n=1 Tax=Buttiauxella gaviniae TaxID=82990 RepID=UPI003975B15D
MLNIAIDDSDSLYRNGMEIFLEELFLKEQKGPVQFDSLTKSNATQVDVVVKSFSAGDEYTCQPILKYRSKPGLIIGIYDGNKSPYHHGLPLCIKDIVFINRAEPLNTVREHVMKAWENNLESTGDLHCKKCLQCKYRTLTPQQLTIAKYLLRDKDIVDIAKSLRLSIKTVSAHKRLIMSNFDLNSDCELLQFLHNLKKHNPSVLLFMSERL